MRLKSLIILFGVTMILSGCSSNSSNQSVDTAKPQASQVSNSEKALEFNTTDKSADTNKNMTVAMLKTQQEPDGSLYAKSEQVRTSTLTKSPYSYLGKVVRLTGEVFKVEELPPTEGLQGKWSEILMLVGNRNSPLGATTVDFIYKGDISKINSGQVATCAGYFLGMYKSENSMGGTVEGIAMVGNSVKVRQQ